MKSNLWLIGPALSVIATYYKFRNKDIGKWLEERRLDKNEEPDLGSCDLCGAKMRRIRTMTGKREGQEAAVCKHYPECNFVRWGK